MDVDTQFYSENVVYRSWADHNVSFAVEGQANGFAGFRKPQRAAAFAVFSHLDSDPEVPATVVMPTGTGKTDTIFAIIIAGRFPRTLMIVPSDALRTQIGDRLVSLQRLRAINAISDGVLSPIVHRIDGRDTAIDGDAIKSSNVTIATPAAIAQLNDDELGALSGHFTHLIFDEAHHVAPSSPPTIAGGRGYAVDTQRTIAVRQLAEKCEHRLFLSATPHNGHPESFTALMEMIDPRRFARG